MSQLTEFAPLSPETNQPSVGFILSKFFKFNKACPASESGGHMSYEGSTDGSNQTAPDIVPETMDVGQFPVDVSEGRSLPNVLKRISNILALKSTGLQAYKDSDLKQYWMPDSVSKECYDCGERFTTFRRRHHCRVCGQIFCSRCCNQEIPGKIMGCTGDLRVCTYCCKVVLSYLQSADMGADLTADLRALQEDLQSKFGGSALPVTPITVSGNCVATPDCSDSSTGRRKLSGSFQEDRFALGRAQGAGYLSMEERCRALQQSASLRALYDDLCQVEGGLGLATHRYRLRHYPDSFLGSELVDWLVAQRRAGTRGQAVALGQALMEGSYLKSLAEQPFMDGYAPYRLATPSPAPLLESRRSSQDVAEPLWVSQIPQDMLATHESECETPQDASGSIPSSGSTFCLDLNVEASTVHLKRPRGVPCSPISPTSPIGPETSSPMRDCSHSGISSEILSGAMLSQSQEVAPAQGWHSVQQLRTDNGEMQAYTALSAAYAQHEQGLLKQLLNAEGLSQSWATVVLPLVEQVVEIVSPDVHTGVADMDVRQYVQLRKVGGGGRAESRVVGGVVCTKNIAHRAMAARLAHPRILLLGCAVAYQRVEGRLLSLEPVLLQEREYLRHVVARLAALQPNLILVHRAVSRLAQEMLLKEGITLALNVKASVLERVARCTGADIVTSVDAHIGRPQLGVCASFYTQAFATDRGASKTLMFFEGCASPHLGCTVLLRGGTTAELVRLKRVTSRMIFARYNWRLEKSFLMDEFALPPIPPSDTFFEEAAVNGDSGPCIMSTPKCADQLDTSRIGDCSVDSFCTALTESADMTQDHDEKQSNEEAREPRYCHKAESSWSIDTSDSEGGRLKGPRTPLRDKSLSEEKRMNVESVSDFSDPLHLYLSLDDDVFNTNHQAAPQLAVAELPLSNRFRKALDDTILSVSPYMQFTVPYLETEAGRNCPLRSFFPDEIFWSAQFGGEGGEGNRVADGNCEAVARSRSPKLGPHHPFVLAKLTSPAESNEVQAMLAHFRACGGRLSPPEPAPRPATSELPPARLQRLDVLDPAHHQRLSVLFCSFSQESHNTPAFCVNPWVVHMDFYGHNDIPLGGFLERYCFRETYVCPSETCDTPMLHHERRFVHDGGCVHISLRRLEQRLSEEAILMWSWCTVCRQVSSVVPMSADTWALSFAKFLELRFHTSSFGRRGSDGCAHSLHHAHHLYFGQRTTVACFKWSGVAVWEVSLPPPLIAIAYDPRQRAAAIEDVRQLALQGYEVFSGVSERLCNLESESELRTMLTRSQATFKTRIDEVQLQLTSPVHDQAEARSLLWHVEDSVVQLRRLISDEVCAWNSRLTEQAPSRRRAPAGQPSEDEDASSCSEGRESPALVVTPPEEEPEPPPDDKPPADKKSVKAILSQLLPSASGVAPIQSPLSPQEHHLAAPNCPLPVVVYENEPSSIIAFALSSPDYRRSLEEKRQSSEQPMLSVSGLNTTRVGSPVHKRRAGSGVPSEPMDSVETRRSGVLSFLRAGTTVTNSGRPGVLDGVQYSTSISEQTSAAVDPEDSKGSKTQPSPHVEVQFSDSSSNFFCRVYFAEQFAALRHAVLTSGEEGFVRSLARCVQWAARGGKSGSAFCKTKDDRFILKEMSRIEMQMFLDFAPHYFAYVQGCHDSNQPTLLGKIVGVYHVVYRNATSNATLRSKLLVMENLFYNRDVSHKFDLKGSVRNRLVTPAAQQEGEIVLLDENLLKMTCDSPLYILPHSKTVLTQAINNDTQFLASQSVMDYSLLVGLDEKQRELVVGIIDYIRTFTWDKKLETMVKSSGILGGQGKLPTVVSPELYRARFIAAMHRYFLPVPDRWSELGRGLVC